MLQADYKLPKFDEDCKKTADGLWEMARWPEFVALMERLGVDLTKPYKRVIIDIPMEDVATVYLEQRGSDSGSKEPSNGDASTG